MSCFVKTDTPFHVVMLLFYATPNQRQELMLQSLLNCGWQITVIAWLRDRSENKKIASSFDGKINWHFVDLPAPLGKVALLRQLPSFYRKMATILRSYAALPDLCILTHILLLPFAATLRGKKIYDASEIYFMDAPKYFGRMQKLLQRIVIVFETVFVRMLDGVSTVDSNNGWVKRYYLKKVKKQTPVEVIWNVPSRKVSFDERTVRSLKDVYADKRIVAFVGGLRTAKGLRVALEAAYLTQKEIDSILFLFIGHLKESPDGIERLIQKYRIERHIQFLPVLPYEEMLPHLTYADVGLALHQKKRTYPFLAAGNGRKFFTYMQAGLAVVAPEFGRVGEAVRLADCGVCVNTESADVVANAIVRLFADPVELMRLQSNGRKAFNVRFCWEKEQSKYLSFLNTITKGGGCGKRCKSFRA